MKEHPIILVTILVALAFALPGCATVEPIKPTASGNPEGVFPNTTLQDVQNKILERCTSKGYRVVETTLNSTVCEKDLPMGSAVLTQLAIGNAYSTSPVERLQFTSYGKGEDVHTTVTMWVQTQMAMGQVNRLPVTGGKPQNNLQRALYAMGAK